MLANLYLAAEDTFTITEKDKIVDVKVTRDRYSLSEDAKHLFAKIHDDWEINLCQKYHYDTLISGKSSNPKADTMFFLLLTHTFDLTEILQTNKAN
jgi:hypothetical protein